MFKKGDRVKFIKAEFEPEEQFIGQIGTVARIGADLDAEYSDLYLINFPNREYVPVWAWQIEKA